MYRHKCTNVLLLIDGMASNSPNSGYMSQMNEDNTFDLLLKEAKAKLRKRKV